MDFYNHLPSNASARARAIAYASLSHTDLEELYSSSVESHKWVAVKVAAREQAPALWLLRFALQFDPFKSYVASRLPLLMSPEAFVYSFESHSQDTKMALMQGIARVYKRHRDAMVQLLCLIYTADNARFWPLSKLHLLPATTFAARISSILMEQSHRWSEVNWYHFWKYHSRTQGAVMVHMWTESDNALIPIKPVHTADIWPHRSVHATVALLEAGVPTSMLHGRCIAAQDVLCYPSAWSAAGMNIEGRFCSSDLHALFCAPLFQQRLLWMALSHCPKPSGALLAAVKSVWSNMLNLLEAPLLPWHDAPKRDEIVEHLGYHILPCIVRWVLTSRDSRVHALCHYMHSTFMRMAPEAWRMTYWLHLVWPSLNNKADQCKFLLTELQQREQHLLMTAAGHERRRLFDTQLHTLAPVFDAARPLEQWLIARSLDNHLSSVTSVRGEALVTMLRRCGGKRYLLGLLKRGAITAPLARVRALNLLVKAPGIDAGRFIVRANCGEALVRVQTQMDDEGRRHFFSTHNLMYFDGLGQLWLSYAKDYPEVRCFYAYAPTAVRIQVLRAQAAFVEPQFALNFLAGNLLGAPEAVAVSLHNLLLVLPLGVAHGLCLQCIQWGLWRLIAAVPSLHFHSLIDDALKRKLLHSPQDVALFTDNPEYLEGCTEDMKARLRHAAGAGKRVKKVKCD